MKKQILAILCASASTALIAQTNLNLETWTGVEPSGWMTVNVLMQFGSSQSTFKETTDPGEGTASAKMKTIYCASCPSLGLPDTVSGLILLSANPSGFVQGIPFTQKPSALSFVYKANPLAGDAGAVLIQLSHWNSSTQQQVVDGQGLFIADVITNTWTSETITVNYVTTDTPDTLIIVAGSSAAALFGDSQLGVTQIGSEFYADNFVLTIPPDPCANSTLAVTVTGTNQSAFGVNDGSAAAVASGYAGSLKTVSVDNFLFTPNTFNAAVGDTVEWAWVAGFHTSTSTGVPTGAATWDSPMTSSNTSFKYPISVAGNYTYECTPHAPGMAGNFTASSPYSLLWNNFETTGTITGLAPGTYTVTVSDPIGCTATGSYTVVPAPNPCDSSTLAITVTGTNETVLGANDGSATASASGGIPAYMYSWSNSFTDPAISGLNPGNYSVTVTDSQACTATGSYTVLPGTDPCANSAVAVAVTGTNETVSGANDGSSTATVTTGYIGQKITVQVSNNVFTPNTFNAMVGDTVEWVWVAGFHTTTSTDVPAGTATWDSPMTSSNISFQYPITASGTYKYKCTPHAGSGMIGEFTVTAPYSLLWSNNATTAAISALAPGTYTVTVTDFDSCKASGSYTVLAGPGGINSISSEHVIMVSPNPASHVISFSISGDNAERILIYDITGKMIDNIKIANKITHIPLDNFSEGVYFYQVKSKVAGNLRNGKFSVVR